MSAWKDSDEVTTTYGSIQLSLEQAHAAGIKTERERIIKLVEQWQEQMNNQEVLTDDELDKHRDNRFKDGFDYLLALIKGENK